MARDDVLEEMADVAAAHWNELPEEVLEAFRLGLNCWWRLIVSLQRARLVGILARLGIPPRVAIALATRWPIRLLPAFDPEKWEIDHKTLPGCSRTG